VEKIFTPEQVADYLQLHHLTVLKLIKSGDLAAFKIGRVYRVSKDSINKFINNNKVTN
jgi:excisionase family DNA binding protein